MMDTLKITILCAVVLFSGYSQYTARQYVKSEKSTKKSVPLKPNMGAKDVGFFKRAVDLNHAPSDGYVYHPLESAVVRDGIDIGGGWNLRDIKKCDAHDEPAPIQYVAGPRLTAF